MKRVFFSAETLLQGAGLLVFAFLAFVPVGMLCATLALTDGSDRSDPSGGSSFSSVRRVPDEQLSLGEEAVLGATTEETAHGETARTEESGTASVLDALLDVLGVASSPEPPESQQDAGSTEDSGLASTDAEESLPESIVAGGGSTVVKRPVIPGWDLTVEGTFGPDTEVQIKCDGYRGNIEAIIDDNDFTITEAEGSEIQCGVPFNLAAAIRQEPSANLTIGTEIYLCLSDGTVSGNECRIGKDRTLMHVVFSE